KIDLSKKEEVKEEEKPVDKVTIKEEPVIKEEKVEAKEEVVETKEETTSPISEITEEEVVEEATKLTEEVNEAIENKETTGKQLPENIEKLVSFMEETGGSVEDYVRLNQDYSSYDDMTVLREYYKQTKSHLSSDEIEFLIEDSFSYDEEVDEERDIKKKKIALKEQVANAKSHLDGQKSKYYEEI
ncbi:MAG: hypothetical protein HWN80_20630, partial [Candidatus Lokiarchaeota archaeon]|nr:hypothetical protein [Candidatus Lokiarchaeota archaeon]